MFHFLTLRKSGTAVSLALLLASCGEANHPVATEDIYQSALSSVRQVESELIAFRHDLHRNPEVSGQEKRTSGKVADHLENLGYDVRRNVGGYGVVATLIRDESLPTIAFRADMDATRQFANDAVPYASTVPGVHHICGHDVHTAIGVGLAEAFISVKDRLPGNVMFVFQPKEEAGTGAVDMLRDGAFDTIKPDAMLGLHTAHFEVGEMLVKPNEMMAGRAALNIYISGPGDVESAAEKIREAAVNVSTVSGPAILEMGPQDFIWVDLPEPKLSTDDGTYRLSGLVMSAIIDQRDEVKASILEAINSVQFEDVDVNVTYEQILEGINNDPAIINITNAAIREHADEIDLLPIEGIIPAFSEDFGSFQNEVPGAFYFLGVNNSEAGTVGFPHSPDYIADDAAILVGIEAMLAASLELMEQQ